MILKLRDGIYLWHNRIDNYKNIGQIRFELSQTGYLKISKNALLLLEPIYQGAGKEAICYKSEVRYPMEVKLLWESVEWSYDRIPTPGLLLHKILKSIFKPKGSKRKDRKIQSRLKGLIQKERFTRLEGSFAKDKKHRHLRKIKAWTKANEKLWTFFGMLYSQCS